jgi:hypothetical protein
MKSIERNTGKGSRSVIAVLLAGLSLAACTTQGPGPEDRLGSFMVTPGKYTLYSCPQLAVQAASIGTRKRDLDALIAKAGTGPGATVAATLAYRTEHAQVNGELAELAKESAAKNCPPPKPAEPPTPAKPRKSKPARG